MGENLRRQNCIGKESQVGDVFRLVEDAFFILHKKFRNPYLSEPRFYFIL